MSRNQRNTVATIVEPRTTHFCFYEFHSCMKKHTRGFFEKSEELVYLEIFSNLQNVTTNNKKVNNLLLESIL